MRRVAKFDKVSFDQFLKDCTNSLGWYPSPAMRDKLRNWYDGITMPQRATAGSAGYDFKLPFPITLGVGETITIPTGIRCKISNGWYLSVYPRSGHGFKYGVRLANTVGIIDSDYYNADNEGHIMIKIVNNDPTLGKELNLAAGAAFCQGIFTEFGCTWDDDAENGRTGGFGSTDK